MAHRSHQTRVSHPDPPARVRAAQTWCSSIPARPLVIVGLPGGGAGPGRGEGHRLLCRVQQRGRHGRRCAGSGRAPGQWRLAPVGVAVGVAGLLGGVGAEQVVEGVPAGDVLGDQVRAGQLAQHGVGPRAGRGRPGWRRPGRQMSGPGWMPSSRNIRAASLVSCRIVHENTARTLSPGHPHPARPRGQPDRRARRPGRPAVMLDRAMARAAATASASGRHAHKLAIRSTAAGSCGGPGGAQPGGQQLHRLGVAQHVQAGQPRAVGGAQPGQLAAAGDQDQAALAGRQHRSHLLLVAGVVNHDQHGACRPAGCGTGPPAPPALAGSARAARRGLPGTPGSPRRARSGPRGSNAWNRLIHCASGPRDRGASARQVLHYAAPAFEFACRLLRRSGLVLATRESPSAPVLNGCARAMRGTRE